MPLLINFRASVSVVTLLSACLGGPPARAQSSPLNSIATSSNLRAWTLSCRENLDGKRLLIVDWERDFQERPHSIHAYLLSLPYESLITWSITDSDLQPRLHETAAIESYLNSHLPSAATKYDGVRMVTWQPTSRGTTRDGGTRKTWIGAQATELNFGRIRIGALRVIGLDGLDWWWETRFGSEAEPGLDNDGAWCIDRWTPNREKHRLVEVLPEDGRPFLRRLRYSPWISADASLSPGTSAGASLVATSQGFAMDTAHTPLPETAEVYMGDTPQFALRYTFVCASNLSRVDREWLMDAAIPPSGYNIPTASLYIPDIDSIGRAAPLPSPPSPAAGSAWPSWIANMLLAAGTGLLLAAILLFARWRWLREARFNSVR